MAEASKRVRPGSIKLLPAEADDDVAWALDQVISRESMTQSAAIEQLNARLAARGLPAITLSSFNRLVVEFRQSGIPDRYRRGDTAKVARQVDPLSALIDARIDAALTARGL